MARKPIELDEAQRRASQDPIWTWRGHAIGAYAALEACLCNLLTFVGDMKQDVAGVIFYKITNADARNAILERLIRKKFGNTYNLFWNSYFRELKKIDKARNEIVHWAAMNQINNIMEDTFEIEVTLRPGNFWDGVNEPGAPRLTSNDLIEFIQKCDVYSRACNGFSISMRDDVPAALRDIYLQPLTYPLPAGHPLARTNVAPQSPPPPSEESAPPAQSPA